MIFDKENLLQSTEVTHSERKDEQLFDAIISDISASWPR